MSARGYATTVRALAELATKHPAGNAARREHVFLAAALAIGHELIVVEANDVRYLLSLGVTTMKLKELCPGIDAGDWDRRVADDTAVMIFDRQPGRPLPTPYDPNKQTVTIDARGPQTRSELADAAKAFVLLTGREPASIDVPLATYMTWTRWSKDEQGVAADAPPLFRPDAVPPAVMGMRLRVADKFGMA